MATSLDTLSLSQLLDLAIGMPQKGTIHFAAMQKLLQAVLGHLDVQYLTTQEPWPGQLSGPSLADLATHMEQMKKEIENNKKYVSEVEALPSPLGAPPPDSPSCFLSQQCLALPSLPRQRLSHWQWLFAVWMDFSALALHWAGAGGTGTLPADLAVPRAACGRVGLFGVLLPWASPLTSLFLGLLRRFFTRRLLV